MTQPGVTVLRRRIEWSDTDAAGIHHHGTIVRLVEAAEAEHMRVRGLDGYFPSAPRVHYEVDYEAPLRFGQEVEVRLVVERVGTSSLTWTFEVHGAAFEGRDRVRAASGRYVTVHTSGVREGEARSTPWPEGWAGLIAGPAPA